MSTAGDRAVPLTPSLARSVLPVASVAGLMMFLWPLLLAGATDTTRVEPPFLFLALLPLVIVVCSRSSARAGWTPRCSRCSAC